MIIIFSQAIRIKAKKLRNIETGLGRKKKCQGGGEGQGQVLYQEGRELDRGVMHHGYLRPLLKGEDFPTFDREVGDTTQWNICVLLQSAEEEGSQPFALGRKGPTHSDLWEGEILEVKGREGKAILGGRRIISSGIEGTEKTEEIARENYRKRGTLDCSGGGGSGDLGRAS